MAISGGVVAGQSLESGCRMSPERSVSPWMTILNNDSNGNGPLGEDKGLLSGLRNGRWLDEQVFPELEYAVPGVVPEGFALLAGAPKIGKSWLVLSWALGIAHGGRSVLGSIDVRESRPTLYMALEDGDRRLQDRCRQLLRVDQDHDPIPERFDYITRVEPDRVVDTLRAYLAQHGNDRPFCVLDTLGKVMPPAVHGETTYSRDYRIGSTLQRLCDEYPGTSLLVNHHDRKAASDDFVGSVSGTNGLAGAADTVIVLNRARYSTTGLLKVTGRDVAEEEYALTFTQGSVWALDGANLEEAAAKAGQERATAGLGDRSSEVAAFVITRPNGVRAADVSGSLGIDEHTARTYLGRLVTAGRIERPTRGLYTPVASDASVAFPDDDSAQRNRHNSRNTLGTGGES